jgi:hypothetical protein
MLKDFTETGLIRSKLSVKKERAKMAAVDFWAPNSVPRDFRSSMEQLIQALACLIRSIIQVLILSDLNSRMK